MVLKQPVFTDDLAFDAQEKPHLNRLSSIGCQIELGSPMAIDIIGHGLGKDIGKRAA